MDVKIETIVIGERIRKQYGDLQHLAESIRSVGLLQPIGITSKNLLVFGERRLRAVRDFLDWETIPARIVNIESIILGEYAENELRKDFTVSERVAIGKQIEVLLGNRQGQRTDKQLVANSPQVKPGKKTRAVAAEKAGFGGATTYRLAKKVIDKGVPELIEAVDKGIIAVSIAAEIAHYDPTEQKRMVTRHGRLLTDAEIRRAANDSKREKKKKRQAERAARRERVPEDLPVMSERYRTYLCDVADLTAVADDSVDCIITDPPYSGEFLEVYGYLGTTAARVLKPGGSCVVMVGQSYLPQILAQLSVHLTYQWCLVYLTPGGQSAQLWQRRVNTFWKPLLWFVKGTYRGDWVGDVTRSEPNDNDKRFHWWGQSESGMADIIRRFSAVGEVVLDPFCGGGTTGRVALDLGRYFIGSDSDAQALQTTRERLAATEQVHAA